LIIECKYGHLDLSIIMFPSAVLMISAIMADYYLDP
jgi:hypothetical protein